jgi:hypothetical protein
MAVTNDSYNLTLHFFFFFFFTISRDEKGEVLLVYPGGRQKKTPSIVKQLPFYLQHFAA